MKTHEFGILVGSVFMFISITIWFSPLFLDQNEINTLDGLNLAYSNHISIRQFEINYVTYTHPQEISIHYSLMNLENKTGFVAFNFPYPGKMIDSEEGWESKNFSDVNSNVVYKKFICTSDKSCNVDSGHITFQVYGHLNSIKSFQNFLKIPFTSGASSHVNSFHNDLSDTPTFNQGWEIDGPVKLEVYLDYDDDLWNTQPISELSAFDRMNGNKHMVLYWPIEKSNQLIAIDYTSSYDRFNAQAQPVLFAAFLGMGVTLLIANIQFKKDEETTDHLKFVIKKTEENISDSLHGINKIVEDERQKTQKKSQEENYIYKVSLLHDLDSMLMTVYNSLATFGNEKAGTISENDSEESQAQFNDDYIYWSNRISTINSNTYVPAEIRSSVSMLLHQGIKPISTPESILKYGFLDKTLFHILDRIIESDYMTKDKDVEIQRRLKSIREIKTMMKTVESGYDSND